MATPRNPKANIHLFIVLSIQTAESSDSLSLASPGDRTKAPGIRSTTVHSSIAAGPKQRTLAWGPNSSRTCRQAPQGMIVFGKELTTATA